MGAERREGERESECVCIPITAGDCTQVGVHNIICLHVHMSMTVLRELACVLKRKKRFFFTFCTCDVIWWQRRKLEAGTTSKL